MEIALERGRWLRLPSPVAGICRISGGAALVLGIAGALSASGLIDVPFEIFALATLTALLIGLAACDFTAFLLPNALTAALAFSGLAIEAYRAPDTFAMHVACMALAAAVLAAPAYFYRRLSGRNGMGMGDIKLMAAAGAWLTGPELLSALLVGSCSALTYGLVVATCNRTPVRAILVPFGAFLCLGIFLARCVGPLPTLQMEWP